MIMKYFDLIVKNTIRQVYISENDTVESLLSFINNNYWEIHKLSQYYYDDNDTLVKRYIKSKHIKNIKIRYAINGPDSVMYEFSNMDDLKECLNKIIHSEQNEVRSEKDGLISDLVDELRECSVEDIRYLLYTVKHIMKRTY